MYTYRGKYNCISIEMKNKCWAPRANIGKVT